MRLSIVCRVASMKSAENVVAFPPPRPRKDREDLAFLPAALEIVETPPSPIGRSTAVIIMLFFALALTWAAIGTVDIVASAQGKIVPVGGIKVIQPFEAGIVRAIHVRDGDAVKAGDLLVELDPTVSEAERGHIEADLVSAQLDVARLRAATAESGDPQTLFKPPPGADPARAGTERRLLLTQLSEHKAKLASIDEQIRQKEAEQVTVTAAIDKLEAIIPIVQERDDIRRTLYDRQVGSKLNHLETMQSLVEAQKDLEFQKSRFVEAGAALASLRQVRNQTAAEQRRQMLAELAEAERKAAGLEQDLAKATQRAKLQKLTAPVAGTIQQLAVHTVGGVVSAAQPILAIAPTGTKIEIDALISNRDIGFVHPGQKAQIKIDTFNFSRYGLVKGEVLTVSGDAITRDKKEDIRNRQIGAQGATSEPAGQELVYAARVALDRTSMRVDDKDLALTPGMAVTVEIETGSRRIISYLLSPLARSAHDSLRER